MGELGARPTAYYPRWLYSHPSRALRRRVSREGTLQFTTLKRPSRLVHIAESLKETLLGRQLGARPSAYYPRWLYSHPSRALRRRVSREGTLQFTTLKTTYSLSSNRRVPEGDSAGKKHARGTLLLTTLCTFRRRVSREGTLRMQLSK